MELLNPRWIEAPDPANGLPGIIATDCGSSFLAIATDKANGIVGNPHYDELIASGAPIAAYVAPTPYYEDQRAAEYPKIGDQLDAIWKQLNQDRLGGKALVQDADDQLNAVLAVKAKYPKPT